MRCPDCRKKIHADDVYCVWCGAPLHRGILPVGDFPSEEIPSEELPEKRRSLKWRVLLFVLLPVLLVISVSGFSMLERIFQKPEDHAVLTMPENAEILDMVLVRWENFTLRAEYLTMDADSGALEILFTAENRSKHTILCSDPLVSLEGYQIRSNMFLELPPRESASGYIRLETAALQSVGIHSLQDLVLQFCLYDGKDASLLTREESLPVPVNRELPRRQMESEDILLLEEPELSARLTGMEAEPDGVLLYILMENQSDTEESLYLKSICWDHKLTGASGYHSLVPGVSLLTCSKVHGVPAHTAGELSLEMVTGSGEVRNCTILLTEEARVAEVIHSAE